MRRKMKDSPLSEVLEAFIEKKQLTQRALGVGYQDDGQLYTQVITNCRGVPELDQALFDPGSTSQELFAKLRSAATIYGDRTPNGFMQEPEEYDQFIIDRRFNSQGFRHGGYNSRNNMQYRNTSSSLNKGKLPLRYNNSPEWKNKCYICKKEGCHSSNHSKEERDRSRSQNFSDCDAKTKSDSSEISQINGRYNQDRYKGILIDTGAVKFSTVGKAQYLALHSLDKSVTIDTNNAGQASICFGPGNTIHSIGTATVPTAIGSITFHVVDTATPFLLSLKTIDNLRISFDNIRNVLIKSTETGFHEHLILQK
ncbi:hypothetical protein BGT96224_A21532 [Blumeria graminis f. sp. tritici 96224]|uniref:Uncharacterized protein n=1 Tax=Blumeria graminis f. sp. tritici 96224 TaxID=1268274 RepID=A0A656KJ66_BLUGR|nr:hypothetical protein BGT96224_A21532 [Blumeria graminis f. sp. tritici 96224]